MSPSLSTLVNILDIEREALIQLEPMARDYFRGAARDGVTLRENRAAFERLTLHYRVLVDVSRRTMSRELLGTPLRLPVLAAPTAFQRLAHTEGELATARACRAAGSLMVLSTLATTSVEDVCAQAPERVWFQLYVYRDREQTRALVARAEEAGCRALVVTVDAPVLGTREGDIRSGFHLPNHLQLANITATGARSVPGTSGESGLASYVAQQLDPALDWKALRWLRDQTRLPVLVKGIVRADDARRAVDHGLAGIIVSNHGGRQLDTAPATISVLPDVVAAVAGRIPVLLDGGVRRGTDVIKALALGAQAVLIGRPILWGLAVAGQEGAELVFHLLQRELDEALALCGCPSIDDLSPDLIRPRWPHP